MTRDQQIDHIIRLMIRGEWHGMKSRAELGDKWGIHERTVGDFAMIASGVLARVGKNIEAEAREALAELDAIKRMALEYVDGEGNPTPKLREATDAIKLRMEILGITSRSSRRNERKAESVEDQYEKMSRMERKQAHQRAIADIEAEELADMDRLQ